RDVGGQPSAAGYVPDMFGHNSQMPQIFVLCGVPVAFIWRGVNNAAQRNFIWRGADGTEIPVHKFGNVGYGTYAHKVGLGHIYTHDGLDDPKDLKERLDIYLAEEAAATEIDTILIHEACDHQEWHPKRYAMAFAELAKSKQYEMKHVSLDEHLRELIAQKDKITTVLEGELRAAGRVIPGADPLATCSQFVIPGVLSSRVRMKQANAYCQTLLCQWAEPFTAIAESAIGLELAPGFLDVAWKWLLQNHAHDSIDGCSQDQIHRDMNFRADQCRIIAEKLTTEATSRLAASVKGDVAGDELRVTVFNPRPHAFAGFTELTLEVPTTWSTFREFFGFENKTGFLVHGPDGKEIPYQRLNQTSNRSRTRVRETKFPEYVGSHHIKVALPLAVPAFGYTTLSVKAVPPERATRYPDEPAMATTANSMANEFLAVQIESNGTLTVTDKQTGRVFSQLLTFEERADIGDGWYHGIAVNDQIFVSTACRAEVALIHNGPMLTTFRVRTTMAVPEDFKFDAMTRSDRFTDLVIDSLVSLRPGQEYLDIQTSVDNNANDHRLRVLFPSDVAANTHLTDTAFDVMERPIALEKDNYDYREINVETKPQQSWTAVHEAKAGLAIIADGLLETTVRDTADRAVALTLFRGTRRTAFTDGEPDGQTRGPMTFRYLFKPLAGKPDRAQLCELGLQLSGSLRTVQLRKEDQAIFRTAQTLPATTSFLSVEGPAVVTSLRQVKGAWELRMFNPDVKAI
ncbi:MAG: glycoside hydrolase family 38 C-terminal domain-containing protein, partial [Opitutaceae bacterium]